MSRRRLHRPYRVSPHRHFLLIAGVLIALLTAGTHWGLRWGWPWAYLAAVNAVVVGLYGLDKHRARFGGLRVPEKVLHGVALAGGTPGAFASQRLFRHKTVKGSFRLWFWIIFALQLGLATGWWYARHP